MTEGESTSRAGDLTGRTERNDQCPHCGVDILGLTVTAARGPCVSPCGHRIPVHLADRLTGAGPAVAAAGDAEG